MILWEQKTWRGGGWRHSVIGVLDVEGKKKALEGEERLYGNKGAFKNSTVSHPGTFNTLLKKLQSTVSTEEGALELRILVS